jgi:hypothetical protein
MKTVDKNESGEIDYSGKKITNKNFLINIFFIQIYLNLKI